MQLASLLILIFCINNYFPATGGQPSFYTRREIEAIRKFRPMVSKHLTQGFMKEDRYLLRFLRSYNFDFAKAAQRLEYNANWRKEKKIDGILNEDFRAHVKYLPFQIGGLDREGSPIVYFSPGKWDLRKYILAGKHDSVVRYSQQCYEKSFQLTWATADRTGKDIDQFHLIADLEGWNVRQNLCLGCIPLIMEMASNFDGMNPVFVKKFTTINTPRTFNPILSLLKSTFPFPPISLITYYDSNADIWKKELLKDISPDQLLKKYGGTRYG